MSVPSCSLLRVSHHSSHVPTVWPHTVMHIRRYRCHSSRWTCDRAKCRAKRDRIRYRNPRSYATMITSFQRSRRLRDDYQPIKLDKSNFDVLYIWTMIKIAKSLIVRVTLSIRANHPIHNKERMCNARIKQTARLISTTDWRWITRWAISQPRSIGTKKF